MLVGCALLGGGLAIRYLFVTSPDQKAVDDAPRITDTAFEHKAIAVCTQYQHTFHTASTLGDDPSESQAGSFLEGIANTFDALVAQLSDIPVAPADQPAVNQWLSEWAQYDQFGHQYASAVSSGSEDQLIRSGAATEGRLRRDRNAFATANHMGACVFN